MDETIINGIIEASQEVVGQLQYAAGDVIKNINIVNGSKTGSLRTVGSAKEGSGYEIGDYAFAEGYDTKASGDRSHAEGFKTEASGSNSHTEGSNTKASSDYQHVQGQFNIIDGENKYADIIGNGDIQSSTRSNAATVDWQGNAWYAGDVYVGSTSGTNRDEGSKKLATEEYIDGKLVQKQDYFADVHDITSGVYEGYRGIDFKDSDGNTQGQFIITPYGIKLTNLDYPSDAGEAASKFYVDQIKEDVLSIPQQGPGSDCILALDLASETIGIPYSSNSFPNSIPQRDENGSFQVWDPINEYDVVPKHYVDNIAEEINNIKVNPNLINMSEGEIGFITVNGTVQHPIGKYNVEAEKTSGFISVEKGQKYTLQAWVETGSAGMWIAYAFYNSDKTFISRSTSTTVNEINNNISHSSVTFTVPANAAFVRISGRTYNNGTFKLEKGEAATPYVANFQEKIDKLDVEKSIPLTYTTIIPSIYTNELPSIDTKAKTLYIPGDTVLVDKRLNGTVSLAKQTFSFTASSSAVCIFYDIKNSTLYSTIYSQCATLNPNDYLLLFTIRTDVYNHGYGKVSSTCPVIVDGRLYGVIDIDSANSNVNDNNPYIHSINHRGYNTVAPENTLSAFKLSKKNGFDYVETDISFTSDNIPVLLHDSTIDRTSNGTGNISEMTFEQVRTYDFGSWKNSAYAEEKIPSFEEFCKLCKQIGLKPYVELKTDPTNEQLTTLLNNAKRYGILNDITWISFSSSALEKVLTSLPNARVGIITSGLTQTTIDWVKSKKTDANDVFIDESISSLSSDNVQLCIADNIPLEVWTVNTSAAIQNADSYITGFTSDSLIANKQLFDAIV